METQFQNKVCIFRLHVRFGFTAEMDPDPVLLIENDGSERVGEVKLIPHVTYPISFALSDAWRLTSSSSVAVPSFREINCSMGSPFKH
jgi:hypothetical protein